MITLYDDGYDGFLMMVMPKARFRAVHDSLTNTEMCMGIGSQMVGFLLGLLLTKHGRMDHLPFRIDFPFRSYISRACPNHVWCHRCGYCRRCAADHWEPGPVPLKRCRTTPFTTSSCRSSDESPGFASAMEHCNVYCEAPVNYPQMDDFR